MLEDVPPRAKEVAMLPSERLGGVLAVIYGAAVVVLMFPVIGLSAIAVSTGPGGLAAIVRHAVAGPPHLLLATLPLLALIVWAAAFVTMTAVRSRSAPVFASVLFALWGLTSIGAQIGMQFMLLPGGPNLATLGPLLPTFAATITSIAAFWGYMREGDRPRRWFVGA
jgi:hypothetical protein